MSITPTFSGEVQLAGWSESHNGGCKVTFWLSDPSDLDAFRTLTVRKGNTAGHRMMAALVEINDDEQPVPPTIQPRKDHSWSRQAGIWCQDKEFQAWVAHCQGVDESFVNEGVARAFVLMKCGIQSRRELDTLESARRFWLADVAGPYRKWRIARGLE